MEDKDVYGRLVRLEQRLVDHVRDDDKRAATIEEISEKQDQILLDLSRYRGWLGGVLAVVTLIVGGIKFFGTNIKVLLTSAFL
jgi:hypothetical protein